MSRTSRSPSVEAALPGPAVVSAPVRRPGSVRRTSHLDVTRAEGGGFPGVAAISGSARDLVTDADGSGAVAGTASLAVTFDDAGLVATVEAIPPTPEADVLLGLNTGFGFRSGAKALLVQLQGALLGSLIDDLSGAPAASGYGSIRERLLIGGPSPLPSPGGVGTNSQRDVCAGWREGGLPDVSRVEGLEMPFEANPPIAPELTTADDVAWHAMAGLGLRQNRRLRRLDLWREGDHLEVDTMFRDSIVDPDEARTERVVHEYVVRVVVDARSLTVLDAVAEPRSLPFPTDCPAAAGSARFIVGLPVGDLRTQVRKVSAGPVSCTHLNDLFRSLADVATLVAHLPS